MPNLDELYAAPYDDRTLAWRQRGARDKIANLVRMVGPMRDRIDSVLEVGCGTGAVIEGLGVAGVGREWTGIDVGARARVASRVDYRAYDGTRIPAPDATFDLVYATHVLEHVRDERGFLGELGRVARRYVYVEVPCELHVRASRRSLQTSLEIGHINAYTIESFALTLATSGLVVRALEVFDHSYATHRFHATAMRATAKTFVRRALLALHEGVAARLMTYHAGALCERG